MQRWAQHETLRSDQAYVATNSDALSTIYAQKISKSRVE